MAWIGSYSKRLKFTIDHTKIDSDLTHFPVKAIVSGANDLFSELAWDGYDDDFTGDNGDAPNSTLWSCEETDNGTCEIQNNKLKQEIVNPSSGEWDHVTSKYNVFGDFTAQVDFSDVVSTTDGCGPEIEIQPRSDGNKWRLYIKAAQFDGSQKIRAYFKINGTQDYNEISRSNNFGSLKVVRSGNTLEAWGKDGNGAWTLIGSRSTYTVGGSTQITLGTYAIGGSATTSVFWDNFALDVSSSDGVHWDEGHPNCLKVAATKDDGETLLYTEVATLNPEAELAVFYISKSDWIISSSVDTVFYLYYGGDHSDVMLYTGVARSTPALNVWDSDYELVYPFSQTPRRDSANIVNSASPNHSSQGEEFGGKNHRITAYGMGVEFDAFDEFLYFDGSAYDPVLSTVECLAKFKTGYADGYIYARGGSGESVATNQLRVDWRDTAVYYHFEKGSGGTNYNYGPYTLASNPRDGSFHHLHSVISASSFVAGIDGQRITPVSTSGNSDTTAGGALGPCDQLHGSTRTYSNFLGVVVDFRISKVARSEAWTKAGSYNLLNTLISYTNETSPGGGGGLAAGGFHMGGGEPYQGFPGQERFVNEQDYRRRPYLGDEGRSHVETMHDLPASAVYEGHPDEPHSEFLKPYLKDDYEEMEYLYPFDFPYDFWTPSFDLPPWLQIDRGGRTAGWYITGCYLDCGAGLITGDDCDADFHCCNFNPLWQPIDTVSLEGPGSLVSYDSKKVCFKVTPGSEGHITIIVKTKPKPWQEKGGTCVADISVSCLECDCTSVERLQEDESTPDVIDPLDSIPISVLGGCPPFEWSVAEDHFWLSHSTTQGRGNTLHSDEFACGPATITVTEKCGQSVIIYIRCTSGRWGDWVDECLGPSASYQHDCIDAISNVQKKYWRWVMWSGPCIYCWPPGYSCSTEGLPPCFDCYGAPFCNGCRYDGPCPMESGGSIDDRWLAVNLIRNRSWECNP